MVKKLGKNAPAAAVNTPRPAVVPAGPAPVAPENMTTDQLAAELEQPTHVHEALTDDVTQADPTVAHNVVQDDDGANVTAQDQGFQREPPIDLNAPVPHGYVIAFNPMTGRNEYVEATKASTPTPKGNSNGGPDDYEETDKTIIAASNSGNNLIKQKAKLFSDVGRLGKEYGRGATSMTALAERVVEGAHEGLIGTDDAIKVYKKFREESAKAAGKLNPLDQSDKSLEVQASKLRQFILMGKGFDDPWDVLEIARDMHVQALQSEDRTMLRLRSTYEALLSTARAQLADDKKGIKLTEDEIRDILFKPEENKQETTALDLVKHALKNITAALDGKKASGDKPARAPLQHGNLVEAEQHIRQVIYELDPEFFAEEEKAIAAKQAKAEEEARRQAEKARLAAEKAQAKQAQAQVVMAGFQRRR